VPNLTEKQKRFCEEYLKDLNATQAAIRSGYSKKTAQEQSSRLLSNVMVKEYIEKAQKKISEQNELDLKGCLKILTKLAIDGESESTRLKAVELLMRHMGAFNDKLNIESWEKKANDRIYLIPEFREDRN
jgi:phage terminase small subunit